MVNADYFGLVEAVQYVRVTKMCQNESARKRKINKQFQIKGSTLYAVFS